MPSHFKNISKNLKEYHIMTKLDSPWEQQIGLIFKNNQLNLSVLKEKKVRWWFQQLKRTYLTKSNTSLKKKENKVKTKNSHQTKNRRTFHNPIKDIREKPRANCILNNRTFNTFFLKLRTRQDCLYKHFYSVFLYWRPWTIQ